MKKTLKVDILNKQRKNKGKINTKKNKEERTNVTKLQNEQRGANKYKIINKTNKEDQTNVSRKFQSEQSISSGFLSQNGNSISEKNI